MFKINKKLYTIYAPLVFAAVLILTPLFSRAQVRMEPPNWWVGMQDTTLQILLHGKDLGAYNVALDYPGVILLETHKANSPSYLFVDLVIAADAAPGTLRFELTAPGNRKPE